jgi:5'-3' exonuclease
MRTLILDSDIIAYKFASANQQVFAFDPENPIVHVGSLATAIAEVDTYIQMLKEQLKATHVVSCLSCPSADNFRLNVLSTYKANRKNTVRPVLLPDLRKHLADNYKCYQMDTLEGDDVMGILATSDRFIKGERIVVSEDKDLRQIPGLLFNPRSMEEPLLITKEMGDEYFYTQILTGDPTDNYSGCPGVGPVKASAILKASGGHPWPAIVAAFEMRGLSEEDALVQARVARILRSGEFNQKQKKVKLWKPKAVKPVCTTSTRKASTPLRLSAGTVPHL